MEFINRGGSIKMRKGSLKDYRWRTLHKGEKMETTKFSAENNGLEEVKTTESSIGNVGVETKQISVPQKSVQIEPQEQSEQINDFLKELKAIKGIGKKTAEDIALWSNREDLIERVKRGDKLPFRDDIEDKLRKVYGK